MRPVLGGSSHVSQDSLSVHFGLGLAPHGTVEVLWPGGVRNRLYHVRPGESLLLPEVPVSFDDPSLSRRDYGKQVRQALEDLMDTRVISRQERNRLFASAMRAFASSR